MCQNSNVLRMQMARQERINLNKHGQKCVLLDKVQASSADEAAPYGRKHGHRTDQKDTLGK
jgi:hypothetical protein